MRITRISLHSNETEPINFDLRPVPNPSQYLIRNIIGLDADEVIPRFYGFNKDKTKRFYDFKLKQREIVMRIVVNPRYKMDETNADVRDNIYRTISATRTGEIELHFHAGASTVSKITGYIVKFEVPYFSKEPELQITIHCNDPMFRGINSVMFEPAEISATNPVIIADSISTAPHGFHMQVGITATLSSFTIQDAASSPEWDFKITPSSNFLNGDILHISSEFTHRHLYMDRSGTITHLADRVDPESSWPVIFPGMNTFHFVDIASFDWQLLEFITAFWGV